MKTIGTVNSKSVKTGSTNGKEWSLTTFKLDSMPFSTFDQEVAKAAVEGNVMEIEWMEDGKFRKIISAKDTGVKGTPVPTAQLGALKSPEFRSPEQIIRCEAIRAVSEVWSGAGLAADFEKMLCLAVAFESYVLNERVEGKK